MAALSIRLYNNFQEGFSSFICSRCSDHCRNNSHTAAFRRGERVAPFLPFRFSHGMKIKAPATQHQKAGFPVPWDPPWHKENTGRATTQGSGNRDQSLAQVWTRAGNSISPLFTCKSEAPICKICVSLCPNQNIGHFGDQI